MDKDQILARILPVIESGREELKIEFKPTLNLGRLEHLHDVVKAVCALANTEGEAGFLVMGVKDGKNRQHGERYITGFKLEKEEQFSDIVHHWIRPAPNIEYFQRLMDDTWIGIAVIEHYCSNHFIAQDLRITKADQDSSGRDSFKETILLHEGQTFIRHGTTSQQLLPDKMILIVTKEIRSAHKLEFEKLEHDKQSDLDSLNERIVYLGQELSDIQTESKTLRDQNDRISANARDWEQIARSVCSALLKIDPKLREQVQRTFERNRKSDEYRDMFE